MLRLTSRRLSVLSGASPLFHRPITAQLAPALATTRSFVTTIDQSETGLLFRFGRYVRTKDPGLRLSIPVINEVRTVDMRVHTLSIPPQELITRDNVDLHVDAVCFFRVVDARAATLGIDDYRKAVNEAAQTSLRAQLSRTTFAEALHDREEAGRTILEALCRITEKWGVQVESVQLKHISIEKSMIRAMSRKAEAERVREARLIEADAEVKASEKLADAAKHFDGAPMAMRLRELQTYAQIAAEGNDVLIPASLGAGSEGLAGGVAMVKYGEAQRQKAIDEKGAERKATV